MSWLRRGIVDELLNVSGKRAIDHIQAVHWLMASWRSNLRRRSSARQQFVRLTWQRQLHHRLTLPLPDALQQPTIATCQGPSCAIPDLPDEVWQKSATLKSTIHQVIAAPASVAGGSRASFQATAKGISPSSDRIAIIVPLLRPSVGSWAPPTTQTKKWRSTLTTPMRFSPKAHRLRLPATLPVD
jgi:hypothetical protein